MTKIKLCFPTGMHGHFVEHLMYCYLKGEVLPLEFNQNGNAHNSRHGDGALLNKKKEIEAWDLSNPEEHFEFDKDDTVYGLVFEGIEHFYYCYRRSLDCAGDIKTFGIKLLSDDVHEFVKQRLVPFNILEDIGPMFNYHGTTKKIPRGILRYYIIFNLMAYQNHAIWKSNQQIKMTAKDIMTLDTIFDYSKLKRKMERWFDARLDFKEMHNSFVIVNNNLSIIKEENEILSAIKQGKSMSLEGLDVVSEARILYELERENFDIPFLLQDAFYNDTKEIHEYIKHFPNYLKQPNKLFQKYYNIYKQKND